MKVMKNRKEGLTMCLSLLRLLLRIKNSACVKINSVGAHKESVSCMSKVFRVGKGLFHVCPRAYTGSG